MNIIHRSVIGILKTKWDGGGGECGVKYPYYYEIEKEMKIKTQHYLTFSV